jgi:hypothetical protein
LRLLEKGFTVILDSFLGVTKAIPFWNPRT